MRIQPQDCGEIFALFQAVNHLLGFFLSANQNMASPYLFLRLSNVFGYILKQFFVKQLGAEDFAQFLLSKLDILHTGYVILELLVKAFFSVRSSSWEGRSGDVGGGSSLASGSGGSRFRGDGFGRRGRRFSGGFGRSGRCWEALPSAWRWRGTNVCCRADRVEVGAIVGATVGVGVPFL